MTGNHNSRVKTVDGGKCPQELTGIAIYHHRNAMLDEQVPGKQDAFARKPDHQIPRRVTRTRVADDDHASADSEGIGPGDREIRSVCELESARSV
jgi:hypothetical protein